MFDKTTLASIMVAGSVVMTVVSPANAAVFNFLQEANIRESGYQPYTLTNGGITVTARGFSGQMEVFAYLDGGDAGLGVCKVVVGATAQCSPSNDDNVTTGERLQLTFDRQVSITNTSFRAEGHVPRFDAGDLINIAVDGVLTSGIQLPQSNGQYNTVLTGTRFDYIFNNEQFYISSITAQAVPEPASALLLAAGLAGAGLLRRRA